MRRTVFALALSLLIFSPALAATTVPTGPLSGNTTWSLANSPYILSNSVTVPTGTTLTVEPGVVVKFDWTYAALTVEGTLSAIGATDTPIIFTSYADDTAGGDTNGDGGLTTPGTATYLSWGDWSGLVFAPGSLATLQHVSARYGGRSFYAGAGMASIPLLSNQGGTVLLDDVELRAHASLVDTFSQSAGETTMQYVRTSEARNGVLVTGGVLTAHQSILEGTNYALLNTSGAPVDATLN